MLSSTASWRDRAEEYRVFANSARDAQVRAGYLRLARHCECLAERHERYVHALRTDGLAAAGVDKNDGPWQN